MKNIAIVFRIIAMLVIVFTALVFPQGVPCPSIPTVTYFGKTYNTVLIGNQCWLKENLDVGTMIQGTDTAKNNGSIEKYCYDNDTNNCNTYGGLYQWNEAMQYTTDAGVQGICPSGWHIPSLSDFQTLRTSVGGDANALKAIGQDTTSTNTSGFSALLAGTRDYNSYFYNLSYDVVFWSSTKNYSMNPYAMGMYYSNSYLLLSFITEEEDGYCVRCVKDNAVGVDDKEKSKLPIEFILLQNYPNPFNPQTRISFSVPKESYITLKVYDLLGREVATLVQEKKQQGEYSITWNAERVPSGVYYYRLVAVDPSLRSGQVFYETKKMVVTK